MSDEKTSPLCFEDCRPALRQFAMQMERKLRDNDHKTEATQMPTELLLRRLQAEVLELEVATKYEGETAVRSEAADVANFALFVFARAAKMTIKRDA